MKVNLCALIAGESPPSGLEFWCPGCNQAHVVSLRPGGWTFDGNESAPTINPSVKCETPKWDAEKNEFVPDKICHSVVEFGMIRFCPDSTHALANMTFPLPDWPLGNH